jgi:hypothetical protein
LPILPTRVPVALFLYGQPMDINGVVILFD